MLCGVPAARHAKGPTRNPERKADRSLHLFHIFFDGGAEIVDGLLVALTGGVDNSVLQVVLEDDLSGVVDGGADGGDLNEDL